MYKYFFSHFYATHFLWKRYNFAHVSNCLLHNGNSHSTVGLIVPLVKYFHCQGQANNKKLHPSCLRGKFYVQF